MAIVEQHPAMAFTAYLSVKGTKQGQFKGEASNAKRKDKWMDVLGFTMEVQAPRDLATGLASGKRQWKPVQIVKAWGATSPQGLAACATNEILPEVVIEFTKPKGGEEYVYQSVKLANATISDVTRFIGSPDGAQLATAPQRQELERWSFTFERIEVLDNDGKTSLVDAWRAI